MGLYVYRRGLGVVGMIDLTATAEDEVVYIDVSEDRIHQATWGGPGLA